MIFLFGLFVAPERIWIGYLVAFNYFTGLGIAALVFIAILSLANASWGVAMRRIPEAMTTTLPIAGLMGLLLLLGLHNIYHWSHPGAVAEDSALLHKAAYLNVTGFALRMVLFFALWIFFARVMVRRSRLQDKDGDRAHTKKNLRTAAIFMIVLTITYSLANFDWLMSIEPHWFSTIYALSRLAGISLSGIAMVTIIIVMLRWSGPLRNVISHSHLRDLGRVMLCLTIFWSYLWYCQYMLIWYANIPEETAHYVARAEGSWQVLSWVNLLLNWLIPFLVLLPRKNCSNEAILLRVSGVIMVGQILDLFMQVGPAVMSKDPSFGIWELGPVIGAILLFFYLTLRALPRASLVPIRDPKLAQSLSYHN